MDNPVTPLVTALDLFGTFIFGLTGAFRAIKYELNILGVIVLATAVGVGGGMTRDMLLGSVPPAALTSTSYLIITCLSGVCVFLFARHIAPTWSAILYADAVGLAVFTFVGAEKAYLAGLGPVGIMVIGTIASVGGGVYRDVLTGEMPVVFTGEIYASACLAGGVVYWLFARMGAAQPVTFAACALTVLMVRVAAMKWSLGLPKSQRLPVSPSTMVSKSRDSCDNEPKKPG
jgi:uncharacterized membrane protein YeiH